MEAAVGYVVGLVSLGFLLLVTGRDGLVGYGYLIVRYQHSVLAPYQLTHSL